MNDCIFCGIAEGNQPASMVHGDETCVAFMDIHPLNRGHVLVIPRRHAAQITGLPEETGQHLFRVAQRILAAQRALGWGLDGSHILLNDGKRANQMVPHVHVHVIPREKRDGPGILGRLGLHVTGIFGRATQREHLDEQAEALRRQLAETAPCSAD